MSKITSDAPPPTSLQNPKIGAVNKTLPYWLPATVMLAIVAWETYQCHWNTLTAWKGGGFGMFSTYDSQSARFTRTYLLTNHGEVPANIPGALQRDETINNTFPNQAQLDALARDMMTFYWFRARGSWENFNSKAFRAQHPQLAMAQNRPQVVFATERPELYKDELERVHVKGVRVELWRYRLKGDDLSIEPWMSATQWLPPKSTQ